MVNIVSGKWECLLEEHSMNLSSAMYVFLGVLCDHCRVTLISKLNTLKHKEIEVFRDQFHLCLRISRDVIRLLQDLVHVPEFQDTWKDLFLLPTSFITFGFDNQNDETLLWMSICFSIVSIQDL
ncbi:hypothetical protein R6Q59_005999 [Mikania micrantha]